MEVRYCCDLCNAEIGHVPYKLCSQCAAKEALKADAPPPVGVETWTVFENMLGQFGIRGRGTHEQCIATCDDRRFADRIALLPEMERAIRALMMGLLNGYWDSSDREEIRALCEPFKPLLARMAGEGK